MNSTTGFQLAHPHAPDRTVWPRSTAEVVAAVRTELQSPAPLLAVQSTGHGRTRGMTRGTLLDTSAMNEVTIDPHALTATVGAGATFAEVLTGTGPHGLAPLSGSFPGVGVLGFSLGGGISLLSRRFGFAADNVVSMEVVTPDSQVRTVSAEEYPELFWAMRGAGSNYGVVTSMTMRVFAIPEVLAGAITVDLNAHPNAVGVWRNWAEAQPQDMMTAATILSSPVDAPGVPSFLQGVHRLRIQVSWSGAAAQGEVRIANLKAALRTAGIDFDANVSRLPFDRTEEIFAEPDEPHAYGSEAFFLSDVDGATLDRVVESSTPDAVPTLTVIGVRLLGGAIAEEPTVPNCLGHREAGWLVSVLSPLETTEASPLTHHGKIIDHLRTRILGRSLNFNFRALETDDVASAFDPQDFTRLQELRGHYDPLRMLMPQHAV